MLLPFGGGTCYILWRFIYLPELDAVAATTALNTGHPATTRLPRVLSCSVDLSCVRHSELNLVVSCHELAIGAATTALRREHHSVHVDLTQRTRRCGAPIWLVCANALTICIELRARLNEAV